MESVSGLLGIVTLKKILAGRSCDFVDRLHHKVTVLLLIVFAAVVSAKQFVAEPIHCWVPAEYIHVWQLKYVNYQCWVQNKYFVAFDDEIPGSIDERKETEIAYYIWVPLILLLLSFLFLVPHLIYRALCSYAGVNLNRIAALADEYVCAKKETREKVIEDLGIFLDRWLSFENRRRDLYRCSRLNSRYLAIVYMTTKVLYLTNLLLVVIILNDFLDMDFYAYGIDVIYGLRDNVRERESPRFPRVTLCDLQIRQLQNEQTHTVQCVLPINLLNEKIFVLLWFWFILLGIVTIINLAKWLYIFIWANNKYNFIRKHLILHNSIPPKEINKKLCRNFAENYIGDNGCFLFRMMSLNCSDLVVNDVVDHLWTKFEERRKQKNDC